MQIALTVLVFLLGVASLANGTPIGPCASMQAVCRYLGHGTTVKMTYPTWVASCICGSSAGPSADNPVGCDWRPGGGVHGAQLDTNGMCNNIQEVCSHVDNGNEGVQINWDDGSARFGCVCGSDHAPGTPNYSVVGCNWVAPTGLLLPQTKK
ncbi:uncharacterized protein LOC106179211 [Lingula anatina]|uniref:Uncharacterized protein LOC106179211 n=1 Tax=Lingula anatina TaxID=7574 RepID=A0A1S3K7F5_LINAN|nr:uncharacterized protein LOC106179211 [Lingula anatina]|eukprot:XP_013418196.1 uncharacterized protein LOC106179211 [Lingula anatina]